jgi:hypothetical protein
MLWMFLSTYGDAAGSRALWLLHFDHSVVSFCLGAVLHLFDSFQAHALRRRTNAGTTPSLGMRKPVWGIVLLLVLLVSCVMTSVDASEASHYRGVSSRRLLRTYSSGCAAQVKWKFRNGCQSFQSCFDGNRCRVASDCCSYRCERGRCCGSFGGVSCW